MALQSDPDAAPKPSSFAGRLNLQDFAHSEPTSSAARRSPRGSAPSPSSRKAITASPSPRKRAASPDASSSPSKRKRKRVPSGYAPPSTYAHLSHLPDSLLQNLILMFVGLNPGVQTARTGHAYAHPSNLFWKLLFSSGVTPRPCRPDEDGDMPRLYSLGFTNIVSRPSRNGAELSKQEMDDGVAALHEKARKWRPEAMCIVGKSIWESIWRVRHGKPVGKAFRYGWQDESENMGVIKGEWKGAKVFVATTTSGLAASMSTAQKQEVWDVLGSWVKKRREERTEEEGEEEGENTEET